MQESLLERACPLIFFLKLIAPYNFDAFDAWKWMGQTRYFFSKWGYFIGVGISNRKNLCRSVKKTKENATQKEKKKEKAPKKATKKATKTETKKETKEEKKTTTKKTT